jgi:hypothetical protein
MAAGCVVAVGVAGCGGMGGKTSNESIAAAQAVAATPPTVTFAQADLDGDARITPREFALWRKSEAGAAAAAAGGSSADDAFFAADTNVNGVLTLDEWQAMMAAPSAARGGPRTITPPVAPRPR